VNPLVQIAQGRMNSAVAGDAGHRRKGGGADADGKMAGARAIVAGMSGVAVAFVHDGQLGWLKGACQARFNLIFNFHFAGAPSICRQND
jgi:hypothetical protein